MYKHKADEFEMRQDKGRRGGAITSEPKKKALSLFGKRSFMITSVERRGAGRAGVDGGRGGRARGRQLGRAPLPPPA